MSVFSCMRLEDVSDSRCRFLGKLIFQAKLFLFWWSTEVGCVYVFCMFNQAPPFAGKALAGGRRIVSAFSDSQGASDVN